MLAETQYFGLMALGVLATATWATERRIPMAGMFGFLVWGSLAVQAGYEKRFGMCCVHYVDAGVFQWLSGAMALISLFAVVLWYFGEFPPSSEADDSDRQPTPAD